MAARQSEDIQVMLDRIDKLSRRPDNPGMAYRNLETIQALTTALKERLGYPVLNGKDVTPAPESAS